PDGRIEGAILIDAEPGQLLVEHIAIVLAEITVLNPPVSNGATNTMNELANRRLPFGCVLLAVKIFRDDNLGGQDRPGFWHFHVLLLKNHLAVIVGNLGRSTVPFQLVKWLNF